MTCHLLCSKSLCLAAGIVLAPACALAQGFDAVRLYGVAPGTDGGTAGAAIIAAHAYQGSDQRRTLAVPVLDYQWANGWFAGVSNGIGVNLSNAQDLQYGLRLTADRGRKERRAGALRGMGDVDASLEVGAFFNRVLAQGVALTSSLRLGSGDGHDGLIVDLGAVWSTALAPQWRLGLGTGLTLANAAYLRSYFGVNAGQSAASGYAVYTPGAGARDVRANLALTYSIDRRTSLTAAVSASRLLGDAKASPLTRQRSAATGVVAIAYAF